MVNVGNFFQNEERSQNFHLENLALELVRLCALAAEFGRARCTFSPGFEKHVELIFWIKVLTSSSLTEQRQL